MFNSTSSNHSNKKPGHINLSDVFLESKNDATEFYTYLNSPSHRRRLSASQQTSSSKNCTIGSSKSTMNPTQQQQSSNINVHASTSSRAQQTRSPQLSVMGYRSDMFTVNSKPLLPLTKSLRTTTMPSSSTSPQAFAIKNVTGKPHHSYRWKTKPSNVARVNNYPDPMYNADAAFLQRISEMAGLEVETMKFEKWKKSKRK